MISGKSFWFVATGAPKASIVNPVPQWSFDLSINDETKDKLLAVGMTENYLRDKGDERGTFVTFTRSSVKKDGSPGAPFRIVDAQDKPWPKNKLVGNGSELNVVITLNERTFRGKTFQKPSAIAIQVWNHVPYDSGGFPIKPEEDVETETKTQENW